MLIKSQLQTPPRMVLNFIKATLRSSRLNNVVNNLFENRPHHEETSQIDNTVEQIN
jgi:hypothetical protein